MKYVYCGVVFKTNVEFPFFYMKNDAKHDYEIYYSNILDISNLKSTRIEYKDNTYFLYLNGKGYYEITSQKMICYFNDLQYMYATICNIPFAIITLLKKMIPLHASSILVEDKGVIAFLGEKGYGKTTIASLLDNCGLGSIYGDDMITCVNSNRCILVNRGSRLMKVTNQTAMLLDGHRLLNDVYPGVNKKYYEPNFRDCLSERAQLFKIIVLERGKFIEYKRMSKISMKTNLIHGIVGESLLEQIMADEIMKSVKAIENSEIYKLVLPDSIDALKTNLALIYKLISGD